MGNEEKRGKTMKKKREKRKDDEDKIFLKIIEYLWRHIQNGKLKKHYDENVIFWKIEWTYKKEEF